MRDVVVAQLVGMKAQLAAMESQIDAALLVLTQGVAEDICQHPPDQRTDMSTMGTTRWQCKQCGYIHEEVT